MADVVLSGARPGNRRRKPKTFAQGRVCSDEACTTQISQYNRSEQCHLHRPKHFPRLRGVFTDEFQPAGV